MAKRPKPVPKVGDRVQVGVTAIPLRLRKKVVQDRRTGARLGTVTARQQGLPEMEDEFLWIVSMPLAQERGTVEVLVPPSSILRVLPSSPATSSPS
jgi:hypothetical protein